MVEEAERLRQTAEREAERKKANLRFGAILPFVLLNIIVATIPSTLAGYYLHYMMFRAKEDLERQLRMQSDEHERCV